MSSARISVVLPVYNEELNIGPCLRGLWKALEKLEHEILVCYDFDEDSTLPAIAAMQDRPPSVRLVRNRIGRGAANALRAGFQAATGDVIVTTMADLSDPPDLIPVMAEKMRREKAAVVSGSRYVKGGSQTGGPLFKRICSQTASLTLNWITGLSTHDATSNFRAYSREFIDTVRIDSVQGFEIALELTVKAHLQGRKIAEVPSSWMDRTAGESRFRIWKWAPNYLRWYWEAMAAPVFVWIVFAAMFAAAFVFVARYSTSMPLQDDLEWAPFVDSSAQTSAEWWWSPFNEHRIPLPRLFFLALVRSTHDIRSGMYFDVCLLGTVALAMILAARKLRGRMSYSDAFFPLLWLTWGNAENLLMMHQLSLIIPSAITCTLLLMFAASPDPPSWKKSLAIGLCLFSLPLCGAPGLTPAPAIVLWCCIVGWKLARADDGGARRSGKILLGSAVATALLIAFYFYDFENPASAGYNKSAFDSLRQAWGFLTLGFGPAGREYWPFSALVLALAILPAIVALALVWRQRPAERTRATGILAIGAGIFSMALCTGIARGGTYEYAGFAARYVTLPSPLLCCVYFAFCLYGPAAVGQFMRVCLCSTFLMLVFFNVRYGATYGEQRSASARAFVRDVDGGMNIRQLAVSHWWSFYSTPADFEDRLECLRAFHFGPLASAKPAPQAEPYTMLKTQPMLISSPQATAGKIEAVPVLLVPPQCEVHFSLSHDHKIVVGRFGVHPPASQFSQPGGMRFTVELLQVTRAPEVIFERVLKPEEQPLDRGFQEFSAKISPGAEGEIILRTSFGTGSNDSRAFGFWTDVEIR
jgi:glycosyltransferase involved in cell wall biosynthesis